MRAGGGDACCDDSGARGCRFVLAPRGRERARDGRAPKPAAGREAVPPLWLSASSNSGAATSSGASVSRTATFRGEAPPLGLCARTHAVIKPAQDKMRQSSSLSPRPHTTIKQLKVAERYPLSGEIAHCKRRDFRRGAWPECGSVVLLCVCVPCFQCPPPPAPPPPGVFATPSPTPFPQPHQKITKPKRKKGKHRGFVRATPHGSVLLSYEWDDPIAGYGGDEVRSWGGGGLSGGEG